MRDDEDMEDEVAANQVMFNQDFEVQDFDQENYSSPASEGRRWVSIEALHNMYFQFVTIY